MRYFSKIYALVTSSTGTPSLLFNVNDAIFLDIRDRYGTCNFFYSKNFSFKRRLLEVQNVQGVLWGIGRFGTFKSR